MKKIKNLLIFNLFLILNLTSTIFSQVQWEKNFEGDRYFASTILRQDDGTFLIGTGDMKVHKIDASGNYIELFYQLQNNTGSWSSFEKNGDNFVGHGGASGYNIFTNIIDANGDQISYNTVSAGGGYSGSGDIIIDEGDIYMAWASNCCGQGQTWDSNVKKFNGLTSEISWNTEICFSCDTSLGGCSQGLDYPRDISEGHSFLLVSGYITDSPCTNHGYLNVVNKSGTKQWEYTERGFHSVYVKSLSIGVSDFIVAGIKGASNERRMFASKFNSDGEIVWNTIVDTDYEVLTTDLISVNDTTAMLFGVTESGIFYATISSSGSILSQQQLQTEEIVA